MECILCENSADKARLPRGWKRSKSGVWCQKCWTDHHVLRAITFPVAGPVDATWDDLRPVLAEQWAQTTTLSNWALTELYNRDIRRNGEAKMPKMPRIYLYPEAREKFPSIASQSVASILQQVDRKYRAKRYNIVWTASESLPNYRYPAPLPLHNKQWKAEFGKDRVPIVTARINNRRWTLRLRGGPHFRRQLSAFEQIVNGEAVQGEMALYRKSVRGNSNRSGENKTTRLMCKLVAWLPKKRSTKRSKKKGTRTNLVCRSAQDALMEAVDTKADRIWAYHADHAKRWIAEHRRKLDRWADDTKAEARPVPKLSRRRQNAARKHRNRMQTLTHEAAAHLVGLAARRKAHKLIWCDDDRSFVGSEFPWFELTEKIKQKCDARGIEFEHRSGEQSQRGIRSD